MNAKAHITEAVKHLLLLGSICIILYLGTSFSCSRVSSGFRAMQPMADEGSFMLIDRRPVPSGSFSPEDVVCYTSRDTTKPATRVGRVIALPGQVVQVTKGTLYVDGQTRRTAAAASIQNMDFPPVMVPAEHVFVMFDQSFGSVSFRSQLIPLADIQGVVIR